MPERINVHKPEVCLQKVASRKLVSKVVVTTGVARFRPKLLPSFSDSQKSRLLQPDYEPEVKV